ncbi:DUF5681 domain-containing protein [Brevundimonas aveniformis]|uniref:DUF5681 domain-containing protein n=1 Tax=Brevundimonas aveniformis TaxID=370977 RepID=UPI0004919B23|nr:DUF5681 domain-containing protein [Brevundimonas aveniformis]
MSDSEWHDPGDEPEDVGYCRPPKRSQFRKGQSGNPKGRPKKRPQHFSQRQLTHAIIENLDGPITFTNSDGVTITLSGSSAMLTMAKKHILQNPSIAGFKFYYDLLRQAASESERRQPEAHKLMDQITDMLAANPRTKLDDYARSEMKRATERTRRP